MDWNQEKMIMFGICLKAPIYSDVYIHLPSNWFDMLQTGLEDEGFKQNKVDPCIFVKKQLYCDLLC